MRSTMYATSWRRGPTFGERVVEFLIEWLVTAVAVWVAAALIDGIHYGGFGSILAVALILGLINALVKPILFVLTVPITIITLGLFYLVLNTAMLGLAAWIAGKFNDIDFSIDDFWAAFFGAIIISIMSFLITRVISPRGVARGMWR